MNARSFTRVRNDLSSALPLSAEANRVNAPAMDTHNAADPPTPR